MSIISLFGFGKNKIKGALRNGAAIIDVRTPREFDEGHIPQSINIPVDRINASVERIKGMKKPIIFCCASGMRSSMAVSAMKHNGLNEVYNGGSWISVLKMMKKI